MNRTLVRLALTTAILAPLAACGDSDGMDQNPPPTSTPAPTPPPPPPTGATVESFGAGFASIFRASADGEPRDPGEGDIIAIDFTTEATDPVGF